MEALRMSDFERRAEWLEGQAQLLLDVSVLMEREKDNSKLRNKALELKEQARGLRDRLRNLVQ
jgi:hypothetical protein